MLFVMYPVLSDLRNSLRAVQAGIIRLAIPYSASQVRKLGAGNEAINHSQLPARSSASHRHGLVPHHAACGFAIDCELRRASRRRTATS